MPTLDVLDPWISAVNTDPECCHIGRFARFSVEIDTCDGDRTYLTYATGQLYMHHEGEPLQTDIRLSGSNAAWCELVDPSAAPRRHDLLALLKAPDGIEVLAGWPEMLRNLRVLSRFVELGKTHVNV